EKRSKHKNRTHGRKVHQSATFSRNSAAGVRLGTWNDTVNADSRWCGRRLQQGRRGGGHGNAKRDLRYGQVNLHLVSLHHGGSSALPEDDGGFAGDFGAIDRLDAHASADSFHLGFISEKGQQVFGVSRFDHDKALPSAVLILKLATGTFEFPALGE